MLAMVKGKKGKAARRAREKKTADDAVLYRFEPGERDLIEAIGEKDGIKSIQGVLRHGLYRLAQEKGLR
jgi:hypothetical protein